MSIFSKLNKTDRALVFSGAPFSAINLPAGDILPDGSVLSHTREGWNTFRLVSCPARKSPWGLLAKWRCDTHLTGDPRVEDRVIEDTGEAAA